MSRRKPNKLLLQISAQRLAQAMQERGIGENAAELSRRLRTAGKIPLTAQAIRDYLKGEALMASDVLYELSRFFKKPMGWFFGEELHSTPPPELKIDFPPSMQTFADAHPLSKQHYIPIRLLGGAAAAGPPSEVDESATESWVLIYKSDKWIPNPPDCYTCLEVKGASMYPILDDGDIVAVDHSIKDPKDLDKKMAVFRINGGVTIKWLKWFSDKDIVVGVPENKDDFDSVVTLKGDEINEGIVGKVAWWWAKR